MEPPTREKQDERYEGVDATTGEGISVNRGIRGDAGCNAHDIIQGGYSHFFLRAARHKENSSIRQEKASSLLERSELRRFAKLRRMGGYCRLRTTTPAYAGDCQGEGRYGYRRTRMLLNRGG